MIVYTKDSVATKSCGRYTPPLPICSPLPSSSWSPVSQTVPLSNTLAWPHLLSSSMLSEPALTLSSTSRFQPILPQPPEQTTRRCHLKAQRSHKVQLHSTVARQIWRYSHEISTTEVESATSHSYKEVAALCQKNWIASSANREYPRSPAPSLFPADDTSTVSSVPIPSSATSTTSTRATSRVRSKRLHRTHPTRPARLLFLRPSLVRQNFGHCSRR
jgi:hypothetical protein